MRASRPQSQERPAPARGQDAHAPAGETPAPRFSEQNALRIPLGQYSRVNRAHDLNW